MDSVSRHYKYSTRQVKMSPERNLALNVISSSNHPNEPIRLPLGPDGASLTAAVPRRMLILKIDFSL